MIKIILVLGCFFALFLLRNKKKKKIPKVTITEHIFLRIYSEIEKIVNDCGVVDLKILSLYIDPISTDNDCSFSISYDSNIELIFIIELDVANKVFHLYKHSVDGGTIKMAGPINRSDLIGRIENEILFLSFKFDKIYGLYRKKK